MRLNGEAHLRREPGLLLPCRTPIRCSSAIVFWPSSGSRFRLHPHDRHVPAAFDQAFHGETDAIFRDHPEDYEFGIVSQALHELVSMAAFKNIKRLFFQRIC